MKFISWNIDSLNAALTGTSARALLSQNVLNTIIKHNVDVLALQETNYVANGEGVLHLEGVDHPVYKGSFAFVPPNSEHQFRNTGQEKLSLICIVPEEGDV